MWLWWVDTDLLNEQQPDAFAWRLNMLEAKLAFSNGDLVYSGPAPRRPSIRSRWHINVAKLANAS